MRGGGRKVFGRRRQLRSNPAQNPNSKGADRDVDIFNRPLDRAALEAGNSALIELIRARIRAHGPVPFAWFMEQALYHPVHGYYSSGRAGIGRQGDYFTNVSVGPVFGRLMAAQFAEMWRVLGEPAKFTIVEQGAHDGQFAHDVLTVSKRETPAFFAALQYRIVEPFVQLRSRQGEILESFGEKVGWLDSLSQLEPFCGVHFSNELLDAFPVHLVRWDGSAWAERHVALDEEGNFEFADAPVSAGVRMQLELVPTLQISRHETEINLNALCWIDGVATKLAKGFVIAVDYGFPRAEFFAPHRSSGSLQCRAEHRVLQSPFERVGNADITAHVEWTSIAERAEARGLSVLGFTDQHHFVTGLLAGFGAALLDATGEKNTRALQTLLHPGFLGMKFQYLILSKSVATPPALAGLRFAREPRDALQLSS